ncbi:MAG: Mu transposase C-terminal domain-containing protein [Actinomycetota bacterium]|nr:Mu transposase C-terminal domain-containing protein [Actinomycetota bacterium]
MSVRLAPGIRVALNGRELLIAQVNHNQGFVRLADDEGEQTTMPIDEFVTHPHIEEITGKATAVVDAAVERLDARARQILAKRIAHVYEAETGYRSGTPEVALPDEPRPEYDPATTTLTQRREAKARELDNEHAVDAGTKMSVATIRRIAKALHDGAGLNGTVDRRHVRRSPGRYSINKKVEAACEEVFEKTRLESNRTHAARYLLVKQYMRETFRYKPGEEPVPTEKTIRRWFQDRFIPSELNGKARARRSATSAPDGGYSRSNPTRPGELVCIDTCSLDVLLEGSEFEGAIRGVMVLAVDWYSRSVVAVRVLEGAERAIDVTFLLREVGRPKPMLPGWGDENRWPFVGLPEKVLTDIYGGQSYAGMPFVNAEAVVTDHGNTYKAHINVATATQQGIDILPARVRTGSDKQVVERIFGSFRTMLLQYLSGYRGSDASERGQAVDDEVKYDVQDIEDLACWWAVRIWQNHELSDARPDWCPGGTFSPNTLYEYGLAQTGVPLRALSSNDYYALLPSVHVKVHGRGVHVRGLFYDGPALNEPKVRNHPSPYGGRVKGKWTVKYDPRDLRRVFFLDRNGVYQSLTWISASRHTPCFNDRHAAALTALRRKRGIAVHNQDALAEILLTEILAVHEPVADWPTLSGAAREAIGKRKRQEASRVKRQERMVERDQAASGVSRFADSFDDSTSGPESLVTDQRPVSPVTALDQARARKNATLIPREEHDDVQAAPRLGSGMQAKFGFDAAAYQAALASTDNSTATDEGDDA